MNLFVRKRTVNAKTTTSKGKSTTSIKGRTIRKVMGGGGGMGKKPKKNSCKGKCQEKNSCKEEGKEKKFMQKEGPIVIFI